MLCRLLGGGEVGAMGGGGGEWQCQQGVMVRARKGAAEEGAAFGQNVLQRNARGCLEEAAQVAFA